ncbi:hypothetical protein JNUCC1_00518 [Lentibacillus sp. JNUCC-1]|uniref:XapX domain-containing protein n=1 Tax=Lentibacillus sp. JNUCC-1 TaxID=2654513 RepID=UPI0012E725C9|nr:DUF1427 family protein [Lentibacillus sp. JNUCC-1]MUV36714.1 hypothetical protein [Lentibacillus sp. JNUCC-1]
MKLILKSLLAGFLLGVVFSLLKLPIPAPPNLPGVTGVVGVFVGFILVKAYKRRKVSNTN